MIRLVAGHCQRAVARFPEPVIPVKLTAREMRPALLFAFSAGRPTIRYIQDETAQFYGIDKSYMTQPDRTGTREPRISHPRQVAMFLARELTSFSLPIIGKHFNRDHSTIIHAIRAVNKRAKSDPLLAAEIEVLRERLGG